MRWLGSAIAVGVLVAGCASEPDRQWMKVNQKYTVEEFRRDYATCRRGGKLDEPCLRNRGWVDVTQPATKETPEPPPDPRWNPRR
jgi:hypothetical protein